MNLEINHSKNNNEKTHVVAIAGEVDAFTAPQLKEELIPLTERPESEILLDLNQVEYMDSTALGVIIACLKSAQKHNSHLGVTGLTPRVERLFRITGLMELLENERTVRGETK